MVGTPQSFSPEPRSHKDEFLREVGPPGPALAQKIAVGLHRGRPGCWIGRVPGSGRPLGVPNATLIRFTETGSHAFCPPVESPLAVLTHPLVLALETQDPIAFQELGKNDYDLGRYLYAAALRDILGRTEDEIAQLLGFNGADRERSARRAVSRGRKLWSRIGGWPWWYFDERDGQPPKGWRKLGGGPVLDAALCTWATGQPHLPGHFTHAGRSPVATNDPEEIAAWFRKHVGQRPG